MSMAVAEVMAACGAAWPQAHREPQAMLALALAMQEASGFDNVAMPFCMTVEAEAYGARVVFGSRTCHPRVTGGLLPPDGAGALPAPDFSRGRAAALLAALRAARARRPDLAVVGNLVGPFSLLAMLADPLHVLRWTRRSPDAVHRHMIRITEDLVAFARLQAAAGIDVLCIADPTATGEILGGPLFRACALPYLERIVSAVRADGVRVIVHICGSAAAIERELRELAVEAVSFDSVVDIVEVAGRRPPWAVMGNVSAFLLEKGPAQAVFQRCRRLVKGGVRLLAPACGIVPTTPVAHLLAMREAAEA